MIADLATKTVYFILIPQKHTNFGGIYTNHAKKPKGLIIYGRYIFVHLIFTGFPACFIYAFEY